MLAALLAALLASVSLFAAGCGMLQSKKEDNSLLIAGTKQFSYYSNKFEEIFTEQHKNTMIMIQPGDATPSILALRNGAIDLAITSRDLNENEDDKETKSYLIAKDALHIVVHPSNPVNDLTTSQLKSIFTGAANNWKELGGSDLPITLISRDSASDVYGGLVDLAMDGEDIVSGAVTKNSGKEVVAAVAVDKQAIGFVATRDVDKQVKTLKINGVEAERRTIYSGRYPLARSIYFVVKAEPSALTRKFVDYFLSKEGQALLEREGAKPLH